MKKYIVMYRDVCVGNWEDFGVSKTFNSLNDAIKHLNFCLQYEKGQLDSGVIKSIERDLFYWTIKLSDRTITFRIDTL